MIPIQWTNVLNPDNIKGLSAVSMLLAMVGNGLMIPRALFIRDLMWYACSPTQTLFILALLCKIVVTQVYLLIVNIKIPFLLDLLTFPFLLLVSCCPDACLLE